MHLDETNKLLHDQQLADVAPHIGDLDTFVNGKHTDAVRQCCLSLLSHNAGVERVSPVIEQSSAH